MTRTTALALALVTGLSGPVYEASWQSDLATLLGSRPRGAAAARRPAKPNTRVERVVGPLARTTQ